MFYFPKLTEFTVINTMFYKCLEVPKGLRWKCNTGLVFRSFHTTPQSDHLIKLY